MAELWFEKINRNTDWGGDESTNHLPVAGSAVQDFIKTELNNKIGTIYHDGLHSRYLCFANEDDKNAYLADTSLTNLIMYEMEAPSSYGAKINVNTNYKAVLINSKDENISFGYDVTYNGEEFIDNIRYEVTITKNGKTSIINGVGIYGQNISINLDEFLTVEGTLDISIDITGNSTGVKAKALITYEVINLVFDGDVDISKVYDLTQENVDPLVVNYSIFGSSNIKYIDWYIDGIFVETDIIQGGTVETIVDNKRFSMADMSHGIHNIQFRAYVIVNGENFYTDIIYKEFIVINKPSITPFVVIETIIPKDQGILNKINLFNVIQFETYTLKYAVYNPQNLEHIQVDIYFDDLLLSAINAPNNKELEFSFVPNVSGLHKITFKSEDYIKTIDITISETALNIQEITSNLELNLTASGKTNNDTTKDQWSYGEYSTEFIGFNWSSVSGWNDNKLVISDGNAIITNIKPLSNTSYGKTIEIEFETTNVTDDNTVICDLRNDQGLGLLISASKASLFVGVGNKENVYSNFKSNEQVRISFVLDSINKLAIIYVNGIMSGAVAMTSSLNIDKNLEFIGTDTAGIKLSQILIYNTQLSSEQILNNYILYRNTVSEMKSVYNRNDVVEGKLISIEKISNFIPVILLTGEEIFWLESQKDTDLQIKIDVEYINKQDPTHQFKFYGGCCRIQGTSSAGYVRKNWRIYSKRKDKFVADVYDWQGKLINDSKRRIAFKEGAAPVNCWTLKADYAESSGTHNTGVATLWNDVMFNAYHSTQGYICRTNAQNKAIENNYEYDCRTTVDGFPIVVFARRNDSEDYIFMGKYNFNNDKSTENVFGFCDIPGFDYSYIPGHDGEVIPEGQYNAGNPYTYGNKMQCWEMRENFDNYALFKTTEGWDEIQLDENGNQRLDEDKIPIRNWASGFEARYPDKGNAADTSDLKAFVDWLISCDKEKFANEKQNHLDIWKIAAYYVYLYRFGAVDQVVKNSMFTSEDGQHWYFINYDNDTILGLDNSGALVYPPTITRDTPSGATYAYAGRESRLWNMLEDDKDFMTYYVPEVDNALFGGGLKYETVLQYFNGNQSDKWCERVYNEDATYKYVTPYTKGTVNTLFMMHGSRKSHRTWWLSKRFQLMDAKFNNDNYKGKFIHLKLDGSPGAEFTIKSSDYMYFGSEYNKNPLAMGIELNKGDEYTFYKPSASEDSVNGKDFAVGDPIYIYSPTYIEELDLSKVSEYIYVLEFGKAVDDVTGNSMKKLIIGKNKSAKPLNTLSGLNILTNLEYLDLTGIDYPTIDISNLYLLKTLILTDSSINTLTLAEGCAISELYINKSLNSIELISTKNLTIENIHGIYDHHLSHINISNAPTLTNNFRFFHDWVNEVNPGDSLNLSGINWVGVSPTHLLNFKTLKDTGTLKLTGKIELQTSPSIEELNQIREIFSEPGTDCFLNNSALWIVAPESVYIHGPREMRSGDSQIFTTTIFSENPGIVEWEIESGQEWVQSIVSNSDNSGVLTTIEDEESDHVIIIKAIHKPPTSTDTYYRITLHTILSKRTIYSTSGRIEGNATINKNEQFTLKLGPTDYNGDYSTEWELTGQSILDGKIKLSNQKNDSVIVEYIDKVIFEACELIAHVTNKNGTSHTILLKITITDESVLMTSTSNPEVIAICHAQGWCDKDVMFKEDAWKISDIGTVFRGRNDSGEEMPGSKIKTFNEFEEFLNVTNIPDKAFFQCGNLTEIKLPNFIETIGSFAFGSTKLKEFHITDAVGNSFKTGIYHTAFEGTPIEKFTISNNINYYVSDGLLISSEHVLIKYPEGKKDKEYIIPDTVKELGLWSIKNTNLEILNIGDNVIYHNEYSISDNNYLHTINLGANISPSDLARHIVRNKVLTSLNIENNPHLCSIDGVLYNNTKTTVWKYPEGRTSFNIAINANTIGTYAVAQCANLRGELIIPDNIEFIEAEGFFACQYISSIKFNSTSKLRTIGNRAFQLSSAAQRITLPASLTFIGDLVFESCKLLGEFTFLGNVAPSISYDTFGSKYSNWCGINADNRIVYLPSQHIDYDGIWDETIFSDNRTNEENGILVSYKYSIGIINV